jgi:hypothetical protein
MDEGAPCRSSLEEGPTHAAVKLWSVPGVGCQAVAASRLHLYCHKVL